MADHARRCAHSMGHGGVLLRSHTRVGPTFPFVQFKPPGVGERIRAVLSGAGCRLGSGSQHLYRARRQTMGGANKQELYCAVQGLHDCRRVQSVTRARGCACWTVRMRRPRKPTNQ